MSTSLRLSDETVRPSGYRISEEALEALQSGDTTALLRSHKERFGGFRFELEEEDADDEDDEDDDLDEDDDSDDDDSDDDEDDEDGPEGKKSKKQKAGKHEDDSVEGLKAKNSALEDEKNRLYRGRQRARQERDDALRKIEELEKGAPGDDELKEQVKTQEKTISSLNEKLERAHLTVAFLSDNTYEWVDPSQALKLADLNDLEIDDDGKVHGLKAALEALATSSPHLLKKKERRAPAPRSGSSGTPPKKTSNAKKKAAEEAKVAQKYRIHQ